MNYAIRVSRPYADCSGILDVWSSRAHAIAVFEHEADHEVNRTHIHVGLYGALVKIEALKRMWKDVSGSGNGFWSFKDADGMDSPGFMQYLTYMSKGELRPKLLKNISPAIVEEAKGRWVTKSPDPKPVKSKVKKDKEDLYVITEIIRERFQAWCSKHRGTSNSYDDSTVYLSRRAIVDKCCEIAIEVLKEKRKRYNVYDFARYITPIVAEDQDTQQDFYSTVYGKIFSDKI